MGLSRQYIPLPGLGSPGARCTTEFDRPSVVRHSKDPEEGGSV
jgi:hypothetical protein